MVTALYNWWSSTSTNNAKTESHNPKLEETLSTYGLWGDTNIDNYPYLSDPEDLRTVKFVQESKEYTDAYLQQHTALMTELKQEMASICVETTDVATHYKNTLVGDYEYYWDDDCYYQKQRNENPVVVLTNDEVFQQCGDWEDAGMTIPSPDGRYIAFFLDKMGGQRYDMYIKDVTTGAILADEVPCSTGDAIWVNEGTELLYVKLHEANDRPYEACIHTVGQPFSSDRSVFVEEDEHFDLNLIATHHSEHFFLLSSNYSCTQAHLMNINTPNQPVYALSTKVEGNRYEPVISGDTIYIRYSENYGDFELYKAPVDDPSNWTEAKVALPDITDITPLKNYAVLTVRGEMGPEFYVYNNKTEETEKIHSPVQGAQTACAYENCSFAENIVLLDISNPLTPQKTFYYDCGRNTFGVVSQDNITAGVNLDDYKMERIYTETVPTVGIDLVYDKRITNLRAGHPIIVRAYGAYGVCLDPWFDPNLFSLLKRGVIFAFAHPRGGGEQGQQWYAQGKGLNKKNTFDDFDICLRHLVDKGYTTREKLAAIGMSAGGYLMGYQITRDNPVASCFIVRKGWTNVLQNMLQWKDRFTRVETSEWGNPEKKIEYENLKTLSPQNRVADSKFPAVMAIAAKDDTNVTPGVEEKWIASLQAHQKGEKPILLRYEEKGGHEDDPPGEFAAEYTFILSQIH